MLGFLIKSLVSIAIDKIIEKKEVKPSELPPVIDAKEEKL